MPAWMDVGEPGEVVDAAADRGPDRCPFGVEAVLRVRAANVAPGT
jgi:hypothetical protein